MISIKTAEEIEYMRVAGRVVGAILEELSKIAREGIAPSELDQRAREMIKKAGESLPGEVRSSFLNYKPFGAKAPFPSALCASVNEEVVHGIPSNRRLVSGDILKLDFGVSYQGYHADAALTVGIGAVSSSAVKLIEVTRSALEAGIAQARSGNRLGDIGNAISQCIRIESQEAFHPVEGLTGHGIGKALHEEPSVFNTGVPGKGTLLKPGMVLAIEPMVSAGGGKIRQRKDDSFITADNSVAAHFEHTVLITSGKPEVLTALPKNN